MPRPESAIEATIAHLKLQIAKLRREQFGSSAERSRRLLEQMELELADLEADASEDAHQRWKQIADTLREKFPKLAGMMDASREDVLAYMAFPKGHWAQIASTNPLERYPSGGGRLAVAAGAALNSTLKSAL